MKKINYRIYLCLAIGVLLVSSCTTYLDRAPESTVSEDEAFKNFFNFQGFIDEIYNGIPDKNKPTWTTSYNLGEDEITNTTSSGLDQLSTYFDLGNFWAWQDDYGEDISWIDNVNTDVSSTSRFTKSLWRGAWYCVRKANLGIENIGKMSGTDDEKDAILGQLYFFRAWWQFEIAVLFGGMPYIDQAFDADIPELERLEFAEFADRAAEDFRKAADLLPIDWDDETYGQATLGSNGLRITKITALAYLGKCYLWASSPLIKHGAQVGGLASGLTYDYDVDYAEKAADALGELIALVEGGQTQYALAEFNYSDIYNHTKSASATSSYSELFYTIKNNFKMPGASETLLQNVSAQVVAIGSVYGFGLSWGPKVATLVPSSDYIRQITANYVEYYGMANGLPLDDANSGYDPNFPFRGRDPRFYHDVVFDGFKFVTTGIGEDSEKYLAYLNLSNGGWTRNDTNGSRTGYLIQKMAPHIINSYDKGYDWSAMYHSNLPYMRLGDVYLMYAEACAAMGGAAKSSSTYDLTALQAINTIRARVGAGEVGIAYTADEQLFMDEVRRERAVELSFEAHRFDDLRRWLLLTEPGYTSKTAHTFDRVKVDAQEPYKMDDWYLTNDPAEAEVKNLTETTILTRNFTAKHYWLPFKKKDTEVYAAFAQNPGW